MKKILTILLAVVFAFSAASAADRVSRNVNDLPAAARSMLAKHFPKHKVNHIKIDTKFLGGNEYDVILNNGTEIDFDADGNWKEIDCGSEAVPASLILKPIREYVARNFKKQRIVSIEVDSHKYDVELFDGTELEFDRAGNFKRIDH